MNDAPDTPDLTDRQHEILAALPQESLRTWAEAVGLTKSGAESAKNRLNDHEGIDIQLVDGEWRNTGPPALTGGPSQESADSDTDATLPGPENAADQSDKDEGGDETDETEEPPTVTDDGGNPTGSELPDRFITALKNNGLTYQDMADRFGWSRERAKTVLDRMTAAGWAIEFRTLDAQGTRQYYISETRDKRFEIGDSDGVYRFGLISDTHLGSKATHLKDLHEFYDILHDRGVDTVLHAGDITDGWEIHANQVNELKADAIGWKRLREHTVANYPKRDGMDTLFISGNHDRKLWRRQGIRLGKQLDNEREDLHWLGDSMARLVFDADNDIDLELIHPSGGQPYTLGYRAQTLYREQPTEMRPSMAAIGHLHGRLHAASEGVRAWYAACWKDLTTYGKRKGHAAEIGGFDVRVTIEDGQIKSIANEFIEFPADNELGRGSTPAINDVINDGRTVDISAGSETELILDN